MKFLFVAFLFCFSTFSFAQKNKNEGKNFHWLSQQKLICASGGQFQPDMKKFNDGMKLEGAKVVFYEGLRGYGITMMGQTAVNRTAQFDASTAFTLLLPAKVSIGTNDSITYEMKGWRFMTAVLGKDIIPGSIVALVVGPGIDWGSLKMKRAVSGNGALYKNLYIAPLGRAEIRFVFGFVALGARGIYRYDITKETWKQKLGPDHTLPGTKNTGTSIEFFIGWGNRHFE